MSRDLTGILDAVIAGIVVLDDTGRVEFVNAAASRILEGQGGRLALGPDDGGDRMLFRVQLPLASDDDLPRPSLGGAQQSDTSATGEFG